MGTQVAAGRSHTVLLKSDGAAVACGRNNDGQCDIPSAQSWTDLLFRRRPQFITSSGLHHVSPTVVLQLLVRDDSCACLVKMSGREVSRAAVSASDLLVDVHRRLLDDIPLMRGARIVLPSGELLLA